MLFPASLEYLLALAMDLVCGFGSSLRKIVLTIIFTIALFAAVYDLSGALERIDVKPPVRATLLDSLNFSLHKVMATAPDVVQIRTEYELISAVETAAGLALVGLFGFVFGNYVRNS